MSNAKGKLAFVEKVNQHAAILLALKHKINLCFCRVGSARKVSGHSLFEIGYARNGIMKIRNCFFKFINRIFGKQTLKFAEGLCRVIEDHCILNRLT